MPLSSARRASLFALAFFAGPAAACTVSATSLDFGAIDPLTEGDVSSTASVTVECPQASGFTLSVSAGNGDYDQRWLAGDGHRLYYNLYTDSGHTRVFGDGTGMSSTLSGDSTDGDYTLYGLLPAQPGAVPATYVDSLTVTVSY